MNLTPQRLLGAQSTLRITESQHRPSKNIHSSNPEEEDPTVVNNWSYDPQWNVG